MLEIKSGDFEENYEIFEELGSGQFAVVKRVREKDTGLEWAAKIIQKKKIPTSRRGLHRADIIREAHILSMLHHPNIISLHEIYENSQEIVLILELVLGGELFDYISEKDCVSEEEAAKFILQVLEGVNHIHQFGIVHLDLKPENIMIMDKVRCTIKIIDFGISKLLYENDQSKEIFGTPEFVAPEVVNFEPISTATDMWSIGVITYILLSGASPFLGETNNETFYNINNVDFRFDEEYFGSTSDLAKDFICKLFIKDQKHRYTVVDCLNHPWIKPRRKNEEYERRKAMINMDSFKSFIARRRWKVQNNMNSKEFSSVSIDNENSVCVEKKEKSEQHLSSESFSETEEHSERVDEKNGSKVKEKTSKNHKRHLHRTCDNKFSSSESTVKSTPHHSFSNQRSSPKNMEPSCKCSDKSDKTKTPTCFEENLATGKSSHVFPSSTDQLDKNNASNDGEEFVKHMSNLKTESDNDHVKPDYCPEYGAGKKPTLIYIDDDGSKAPLYMYLPPTKASLRNRRANDDTASLFSSKSTKDKHRSFPPETLAMYGNLTSNFTREPDTLADRDSELIKNPMDFKSPLFNFRGRHGVAREPLFEGTASVFDSDVNKRDFSTFDEFSRFSPKPFDRGGLFRGDKSEKLFRSTDRFFKRNM